MVTWSFTHQIIMERETTLFLAYQYNDPNCVVDEYEEAEADHCPAYRLVMSRRLVTNKQEQN